MAGFHPHMPASRYSVTAKALSAAMWFWVMYKAKEEGAVVLKDGNLYSAPFLIKDVVLIGVIGVIGDTRWHHDFMIETINCSNVDLDDGERGDAIIENQQDMAASYCTTSLSGEKGG
ncbi:hypothetical protein BGZ65_010829 [Modicella reniformis]|uniref:Uncharacterized protein n=1 Tax=Modicella reniformis TaxID=1440133 RepID=A0A9P6MAF7_9FUNG|nr:hypothetical protein BGZ65_010829 [Modicella reniformis]